MKDYYKVILHSLFQYLIIISAPVIIFFYWPNHEERLMKYVCYQMFGWFLLALSFLFIPKRDIDNPWPAMFLLMCFVNLFTHGMSDFVNVGIGFILTAIIGVYVISTHLHLDNVSVVKKAIVITCLINCFLFLTQVMGMSLIFQLDPTKGYERPSGFMCYPASFALLCAISILLAWDWKKWLVLPMGLCIYLSQEYSVILGLLAVISIPFWKGYWKFLVPITSALGALFFFKEYPHIYSKVMLRMKFIYPVFQNVWARPIDGWGVGMYNRLPESFFGFNRSNWSELHCEPLDLLFSMGILGVGIVIGWINHMRRSFTWNAITKSAVVYGIMSFFHSPLHFCDTLWLGVVIYSLWEIERYESAS